MKTTKKNILNQNINRRTALTHTLGFLGATLLAHKVMGQTNQCPEPPRPVVKFVESEISRNHGHEFNITLDELVNLNGQNLSIQGRSGHPHTIVLNSDQVLALMKGETIEVTSSQDAGHTHQVLLRLVAKEV